MARHMEIVAHLHDAEATDDLFKIVLVPSNIKHFLSQLDPGCV